MQIFIISRIKTKEIPLTFQLLGYNVYSFPAKKNGYSGVLTLSKIKPNNIKYGIGIEKFDIEGRIITIGYDKFYLINVYFPNAGIGTLKRLEFKLEFDKEFEKYVLSLNKPCIICRRF